jgi:hypothetical protein
VGIAPRLLCALAGLGAFGCGDMCGNEPVAEYRSPDGVYKVVVFQRDCGATTGFSTQASLIPTDDGLPESSGNLFIADTDHGKAPAASWGGPELEVEWQSPQRLLLRYDHRARVFVSEPRVEGIDVRYDSIRSRRPDNNELQRTRPAQAMEPRR